MKIKIENVRLAFPSLFKPAMYNGQITKFEGTFLLDKDKNTPSINKLNAAINELAEKNRFIFNEDDICLKDGDGLSYSGYGNSMALKASNKRPPIVVDRDKTPLVEDDGKPYDGCYVNAVVTLWYQDNQYGQRINASLDAVQFNNHGEKLINDPCSLLDDLDENAF